VSIASRLLSGLGIEQRATLARPSWDLVEALTTGQAYSGQTVTVASSLSLVPVYSAVSRIAGSVGSLPLIVYRRLPQGGKERAENHRTWRMLHDQPNESMGSDEFWEIVEAHLLLWGNAFVAKIRDSLGMVSELWPMEPSRVKVGRQDDGTRYFVLDGKDRYTEADILHIRGLGTDGLVGLSPIQQAKQMLGGALAHEEFSGRFWGNSANPGGVLTHPNKLSDDAAKRIKARWREAVGGVLHAGETVVLEEGMEWKQVGMPLEDAQFIETAKFSDLRVAQLFRLPPYMLGASSGDSMTYSNTESQGIDFVRWTLRPWLVRIEKALLRDPSIFLQGSRIFPEFLTDALQRADTKTRYDAYKVAIEAGFLTAAEAREMENRPPLNEPAQPEPEPTENE